MPQKCQVSIDYVGEGVNSKIENFNIVWTNTWFEIGQTNWFLSVASRIEKVKMKVQE